MGERLKSWLWPYLCGMQVILDPWFIDDKGDVAVAEERGNVTERAEGNPDRGCTDKEEEAQRHREGLV